MKNIRLFPCSERTGILKISEGEITDRWRPVQIKIIEYGSMYFLPLFQMEGSKIVLGSNSIRQLF